MSKQANMLRSVPRRRPEDRGITADALQASAAIPWLFPTARGSGDESRPVYWDGLFSQNPPIANFFAGMDHASKPDEIWIAQVNPQRCKMRDFDGQLWDRRNELSGNLSLNQEVAAIGVVNARVTGDGPVGEDKRVQILRIAMDSERLQDKYHLVLGPASKLDRSAALMDRLFRHGELQARAFLPVRALLEQEWNRPGATPSVAVEGLPPAGIEWLRTRFGPDLRFNILDMTLETPLKNHGGEPFPGEELRARLSWHCNIWADEAWKRLEGIAVVGLGTDNKVVGARITNLTLSQTDFSPKHVAVRTLPTGIAA